ncbi:MAG: hypothetical protein WAP04_05125 [Bacillota bacterium]|nr:hypothetical protein [Bacillota bacterium]HPO80275.1 hypothetical protein [Bacillota bacterium]
MPKDRARKRLSPVPEIPCYPVKEGYTEWMGGRIFTPLVAITGLPGKKKHVILRSKYRACGRLL